ncbi:SPOR domain-containing protein [uncultured Desulfobacter sp.]|uniref:SPOR domain-containing protein n=1 Tax=uncultured Desulfobacter sp. TaxID=240139 RepID=UPI002AAB789E|nr:SPOR domain-containing protein [uncultured Desulfobacter sp.]
MFSLGVFVGRGSSPVLFETRPFQQYLGQMARELAAKMPEKEKIDLKFYDLLDEPVFHQIKGKQDLGEITPGPETGKPASVRPEPQISQVEGIPVKRSRKLATWHQAEQGFGNDAAPAPVEKKSALLKPDTKTNEKQTVPQLSPKVSKSKSQTDEKIEASPERREDDAGKLPASSDGAYTIQIASYKDLSDALTHMVRLKEKGISSYRVSVKINGVTWYRIRTGSFADYQSAGVRLTALSGSGVNGMIVKKE